MTCLYFDAALLPDGWENRVRIEIDRQGWITDVASDVGADAADFHGAIAVPGMPNLHSHAFQRAMAGLTENRGPGDDSFWTWRQAMYQFVQRISPDDLTTIAAQLYAEMLEAGFTSVAEFHYLHHNPDGGPYDDIGAMSMALAEAVSASGIGMTFLPVFYGNNGFGGAPCLEEQRRFANTPEYYVKLHQRVGEIAQSLDDAVVGQAPHSLRAVTPESLAQVVSENGGPVHIHIAEQMREVTECLDWSGSRPVDWLLDHMAVAENWCLVHATHMSERERQRLAASGAVAGLCPITEANLGDGIFAAVEYLAEGGAFGIGSDSNVAIGVAAELQLLEYGQRLRDQGRNRLVLGTGSVGRSLYDQALAGGARACGRNVGRLQIGYRGDIVSLDGEHPALIERRDDHWLDGWLFAGDNRVVRDVWVGGNHLVAGGIHIRKAEFFNDYRRVLRKLLQS